jgi:hypothetical protein
MDFIYTTLTCSPLSLPKNLYAAFTRYAAVQPIDFTATAPIVGLGHPWRLQMLDIAYIAGLLISFGLFYGFSYLCSRL